MQMPSQWSRTGRRLSDLKRLALRELGAIGEESRIGVKDGRTGGNQRRQGRRLGGAQFGGWPRGELRVSYVQHELRGHEGQAWQNIGSQDLDAASDEQLAVQQWQHFNFKFD